MWFVSSRSGVATLRTAIHLLLTYLLPSLPDSDPCSGGATVSVLPPATVRSAIHILNELGILNNNVTSSPFHALCAFV